MCAARHLITADRPLIPYQCTTPHRPHAKAHTGAQHAEDERGGQILFLNYKADRGEKLGAIDFEQRRFGGRYIRGQREGISDEQGLSWYETAGEYTGQRPFQDVGEDVKKKVNECGRGRKASR